MVNKLIVITALFFLCTGSYGFVSTTSFRRCGPTELYALSEKNVSRSDFLKQAASAAAAAVATSTTSFPTIAFADESVELKSGVKYVVTKQGDGPKPSVGELAGIRFKAVCVPTGNVIDDITNTPEPYYTRVGSGGLIKGVEEVIPLMRVGDRFFITVPGPLAFGPKGRPSSAGKPRIPSNAEITFDVEMVGLPGKEQELIDLIGDE